MNLLPDYLAENDFSIRAGLARVMESVGTDVNNLAHPGGGFDVGVLVDEEKNVHHVDGGTKLLCSRPI